MVCESKIIIAMRLKCDTLDRQGTKYKGPSEGFEPSSSGVCLKAFIVSSPQPPILTRLYYEGHFISSAIMVLYIISR